MARTPASLASVLLIIVSAVFLLHQILQLKKDYRLQLSSPLRAKIAPKLPQVHAADLADIHNATLGFGNIFAVSLAERTDRRDAMLLMGTMTGLDIEFIDGVKTEDVPEKALPYPAEKKHFSGGDVGSWRAHLNALSEVIRRNLTTALILEDDIDWDIRIKNQLFDYALTVQALTQPLAGRPNAYADRTFPVPGREDNDVPKAFDFENLPATEPARFSPYGDNWDILWLGHCTEGRPVEDSAMPRGAVEHYNDETVPLGKWFEGWENTSPEQDMPANYPPHTRLTHHAASPVCTFAYAVTQASARRLLYAFGLKKFERPFDVQLNHACLGTEDRARLKCLTVQPQLFNQFKPSGDLKYESDNTPHGGVREKAKTEFIRVSTRLNLENFLQGKPADDEQWPDEIS
ncbi:MAG: hypothetical protein Q9227_003870 [Pyrenula ochraceoflavens]